MRPPRLVRALLALATHPDDRDDVLDDLDEELVLQAERDGPAAARRWYRAQAVASLGPLLARRLRRRPRPSSPTRPAGNDAMGDLMQDFRFAFRSFLRRPGFSLVAVATLALAIGATTALFSVINGVLLRTPPGVADGGRVVEIADGDFADLSYPIVRAMARSASLEEVAAIDWSPLSVGGAERPEVRLGMAITGSYLDALGVVAARGRTFAAEEAAYPSVRPVAVISERLRAERYADADIPGATLVVNGVPLTVIGVAGRGFRGHAVVPVDVFVPLGLPIPGMAGEAGLASVPAQAFQVIGRLRPGVSAEQAEEELTALAAALLRAETGAVPEGFRVRVEPWGAVPAAVRGSVAAFLAALLLLVGLVLAMASINVAGMMLSRSAERGDEIAVRVAMGAGRGRITRQLLTEATALALVGAAFALPLAWGAGRVLLAFEPPLPPGYDLALDFGLDARVLTFALVAAVGSALLFNLAPALHAARTDVMGAIKGEAGSGRRARTWGRSALVSGQMALSLVLLATAGLFLRSLAALHTVDPGWSAADVLTTDLDLELTGTPDAEGTVFFRALRERMAGAPGVRGASLAHKLPLGSTSSLGDVTVAGTVPPEGRAGLPASFVRVSPGYFGTLDLALLEGRDFTDADGEGAPGVAIVNRTMARRLWPEGDAPGRTFRVERAAGALELTVVGVVEDARYGSLFEETPNFYYLPSGQWYNAHMLLFLEVDPARADDVRDRVEAAVAELQPNLPAQPLVPLEASLAMSLAPQRIAAWVSGVLGGLGLLLGAVGVYGVTAFAVSRRVREIGIRVALGATRADIVALILRQGMVAPAVGLVLGLLGALAVARLVAAFLAGFGTADPAVLAAAAATLLAVAAAATLVPAWRAARGSPVHGLRAE